MPCGADQDSNVYRLLLSKISVVNLAKGRLRRRFSLSLSKANGSSPSTAMTRRSRLRDGGRCGAGVPRPFRKVYRKSAVIVDARKATTRLENHTMIWLTNTPLFGIHRRVNGSLCLRFRFGRELRYVCTQVGKHPRCLSVLLLAWLVWFWGVADPTVGRLCAQDLDSDAFAADLTFLADELPQRHKELFAATSAEAFTKQLDQLRAAMPNLNASQRHMELSRLLASLRDGHTQLAWDFSAMCFLPINVRWLDDQVAIVAADAKYESLLRAEILEINSVSIEVVLDKAGAFLSHDNEYGLRDQLENVFNCADLLHWACRWEGQPSDPMTLRLRLGEREWEETLTPIPHRDVANVHWVYAFAPTQWPLPERKSNLDFWNDWLPESKTIYFKYNRCRDPQGFASLVQKTKAFAEQRAVDKFVLDLRHNGGGNSSVIRPLIQWLGAESVQGGSLKCYVIVGRGTFSSGLWAAYDMKKLGAVVVGEPSGGKPNHFGEVKVLVLPRSKWRVFYSTKFWTLLPDSDPPYLEPDLPVQYRGEDFFQGSDAALAAIFQDR